jgi:RNA recognition motif-containing protein
MTPTLYGFSFPLFQINAVKSLKLTHHLSVSVRRMRTANDKESRYCFVELGSAEEVAAAQREFNGAPFLGKYLRVDIGLS